jgi:hypothetical protein
MVESGEVAMSVDYKEFELKHNRHLNMMQENVSWVSCFQFKQDRNLRRQALAEFSKVLEKEKSNAIVEFFFRERLARRLVISLDD